MIIEYWFPALLGVCVGMIIGAILTTVLLVFVVKEGEPIGFGHHIHHHGDEENKKKEYDGCE